LLWQVLVVAPMVLEVHRAALETVSRIGGEHGRIEGREIGPRNQQGHHQHVPHGLTALEFHHGYSDDIPVFVAFVPSVHHTVEQDHIDSHQGRQIKHRIQDRRGIPMENADKKAWYQIPGQRSRHYQQDTHGTVPPLYFPDGFGRMGFLDDIHNVGAINGPAAQGEQHRHHINRSAFTEGCRASGSDLF